MKKSVLLLCASALLLFAGCAKDGIFAPSQGDGELSTVTFTAQMGCDTKAAADLDGDAYYVNRCIMEVYYGDDLFSRKVATVSSKKAEFQLQLVSNRTYTVAFWADCATPDAVTTFNDLYYSTPSLKNISVIAPYVGNNDARDAFFSTGLYTVAQDGKINGSASAAVILKRPFAQINVRTNDLQTVKLESLCPTHVNVKFSKMYMGFNAVTGEPQNEQADVLYENSPIYKNNLASIGSKTEATLSMDYILAEAEEAALVDITWQALKSGDATVEHNLTSIPFKRNYRTNILGALLTTTGKWNVTVDPAWSTPDEDIPYFNATVSDIASLNGVLASSESAGAKKGEVTTTMPNDSDENPVEFTPTNNGQDLTLNFTGELGNQQKITFTNTGDAAEGPEKLTVNAPSGTKLEFNGQNHVTVNGDYYESITGEVSATTLVIEKEVEVKDLIMKAGGLEVHGAVTNITIEPVSGKQVLVRTSENLSQANFDAVKAYIAPGFSAVKKGDKYDIVETVCKIGEIGYATLADALASIPANNSSAKTIEILQDITLPWAEGCALDINKPFVTIDGQGHKITAGTGEDWDKYKVGGSSQSFGSYYFIKVTANNVTVKNLTVDGLDYRGISLLTTTGGKDALYENVTYIGRGSAHYYGYSAGGKITFKECVMQTRGYAVHCAHEGGELFDVIIEGCKLYGWNSFGTTKSVTVKDSYLGAANDEGKNGVLAIFRPFCPATITNTTFSQEYADKQLDYVGLGTGAAVNVILNECKVEGDNVITDIVNYNKAFDETNPDCIANSVFAFDATGNETDGYYGGTFVTKNPDKITVKSGHKVNKLAENIYNVIGEMVVEIGGKTYRDIHEAISALSAGQTMSLVADITSDRTLCFDKGVEYSLDLAGHTLTVESKEADGIVVSNGTTLNLTNSVADHGVYQFNATSDKYDGIYVISEAEGKTTTLNVKNPVKLYVASSVVQNAPIHAYAKAGKAVVNMYEGTLVKVKNTSSNQMTAISIDQNSEFNMYGGEFEIEGTFGKFSTNNDMVGVLTWAGNGTKQNGVVNLLGGTFTVGGINAFAQAVQIGYTNTSQPGATVNVNGANINLGPNPGGYSFAFTMVQDGAFNISGNTVVSKDASLSADKADLFAFQWKPTAAAKRAISITGGKFFAEPAKAYIPFGYIAEQEGEYWVVKVDSTLEYTESGKSFGLGVLVDGIVWAPVNCGSSVEDGGLFYQWGRKDGQTKNGTPTLSGEKVTDLSKIDPDTFYTSTDNWLAQDRSDLWNAGTDAEPVKSEYDPCPDGWRVATNAELLTLHPLGSKFKKVDGKYSMTTENGQTFIWPALGGRDADGNLCAETYREWAFTWSSNTNNLPQNQAWWHALYPQSNVEVIMQETIKADALPVRCVKIK